MFETHTGNQAHKAAAYAALAAACLASAKLALFGVTGSLIVALSAWDSAMDVVVSFINQRIIRFARTEADSGHPYGHGKAESVASLGQGALIIGGALVIVGSSIQKLGAAWRGAAETVQNSWFAAGFFVIAGMGSAVIALQLRRAGRRHDSPALLADSEHYNVDVVTNLASAAGIGLVLVTEITWLDPLLAGAFAIYIARGGISLMRTAVDELMDRDIDDAIKTEAVRIIAETDARIVDIHKFRGRKSGHRYFFDFHVTLPATLDFPASHTLVENIEDNLKARFDADVVVHADPDTLSGTPEGDVILSRRPKKT
ncbi:MAG: cation transporter [Silvanigrellales bacterium]|jgi:cation diffusion facilitator family transporter|nr:cation transporter [Silvanigrellales bacterium]